MTLTPPFDDWKRRMDDYDRRINVLAGRTPMPGAGGAFFTQQLASVRNRHAQILELIERSRLSPDHGKSEEQDIATGMKSLEEDLGRLETEKDET